MREANLPELVAVLVQLGEDFGRELGSVADVVRVQRRWRRVRVVQAVHDLFFLDVVEQCRQAMLGQHDRRRDASYPRLVLPLDGWEGAQTRELREEVVPRLAVGAIPIRLGLHILCRLAHEQAREKVKFLVLL